MNRQATEERSQIPLRSGRVDRQISPLCKVIIFHRELSMKKDKNWIIILTSCVYFLIIISTLFYTFTGNLSKVVGRELPRWYAYYMYITAVIYIAGFIFILKMKRWALVVLSAITVLLYLSTYFIGVFNIYSLITDIIIFGILWTQYGKMHES